MAAEAIGVLSSIGGVPGLSALIGALLGGVAVFQYRSSVTVKRLEWLLALFERYMDEAKFRRIRYIMVFRVQPEFDQLKELMSHRAERRVDRTAAEYDKSLIMDMDDYLNFFELIATLWKRKELRSDEIRMLYNDYIRCLWQIDFTHAYIMRWGFESLAALGTFLLGPGPLPDRLTHTTHKE